uniref:DNA endonuclease RBBP8 n=1 Tax=Erpetoichthys calabaricus TaxID=27687 RepID=A0A8C4S1Z7_ERPCA
MNSTAGSCSSPASGTSSDTPSDLFRDLLTKLKDCHDIEVQGLQFKVSKLKKERCLDAQRLEEFYSKNQQLREQLKALQDNVKILEDRLRAGLCDRCAVTEEHMRKKQVEFENIRQQNLRLITELMNDRNVLQDENKKLCQQLEQLTKNSMYKFCNPVENTDQEDGVIPDSPIHQISLSMPNRMRRKKDCRHVRYAEKTPKDSDKTSPSNEIRNFAMCPLLQHGDSEDVLAPETCPLDSSAKTTSHLRGFTHSENPEVTTDVAETVGLCSFDGTESRRVVNLCGNDDLTLIQKCCVKQECDSKRPLSTDSVLLKEIGHRLTSTKNKDLLTQERISPVFGGPARASKYLPILVETESTSVLGQHAQNVPGYGRLRTKTEDAVSLAPLNVESNSGQGTKYNGKKKKSEDDNLLSRNCKDLVNGEEDAFDKPLDLSDHLAGERPQENRENREWLKQATLLDVLKASVKMVSSAQKHCGVNDFSSKNSTENSHLEEAARRSHEHDGQDVNVKEKVNLPNFKKPMAPIKLDTEGNHVDIKQTSDAQEPKKKKVRTSKGDSEAASVLQLNPCLSARMILQQKQDDGDCNPEDMSWSIDPGADLSQYKKDSSVIELKNGINCKSFGETVDMDCTYVSESMLMKGTNQQNKENISDIGEKANDSLGDIFDQTIYGEYESCPQDRTSSMDSENDDNCIQDEEDNKLEDKNGKCNYCSIDFMKHSNRTLNYETICSFRDRVFLVFYS